MMAAIKLVFFQEFNLMDQSFNGGKLLLFMFHVCHLMVLYHPNSSVDVSYVQLFKALESARYSNAKDIRVYETNKIPFISD